MVPDIIDGISIKLNQVFGNEYEIYGDEDIKQGLKRPCFFIAVLAPSQEPMLKGRYFRRNPFDVHYFPKKDNSRIEIEQTAGKLYEAMEYIALPNGDTLRGTGMSYEVVDSILHFFVSFNHFVVQNLVEPDSEMDGVVVEVNTEG